MREQTRGFIRRILLGGFRPFVWGSLGTISIFGGIEGMRVYEFAMYGGVTAFGRIAAWCCIWGALGGLGVAHGQTRVFVEHEGQMLPVVAMDGEYPLVEVGRERQRVYNGNVTLTDVGGYTDGAVRVLSRDAVMGQDYGSAYGGGVFRFVAEIEAERDFEDCFLLFAITPENGEPVHAMREVADIAAARPQRLSVSVPVNAGFGGGTFGFKLFSDGEEVEVIDPQATTSIRDEKPSAAQSAGSTPRRSAPGIGSGRGGSPLAYSSPVKVIDPYLPNFPDALTGTIQGGYTEAVFSIDRNGEAEELLDLKADHPGLIPETIRAITQTRYAPSVSGGEPSATTVSQRFFFNEFASFPEEMVVVPYPSLDDRNPLAVYYPLPEVSVRKAAEVKVEVTVDRLGVARSARILSSPNDELADATLEKVKEWIFLPAVENHAPVSKEVVVPIRFRPPAN